MWDITTDWMYKQIVKYKIMVFLYTFFALEKYFNILFLFIDNDCIVTFKYVKNTNLI